MTTTMERTARPDTAAAVLASACERRAVADAAEADLLQLAVDWVAMHSADARTAATMSVAGFGETDLAVAGPGAPTVAEFSVAEFALAVGLSHEAGKRYLGESVELCHRLPRLWARVMGGELPAWKGRLVARETIRLSSDAADFVDRHVSPVAHKVRPAQVQRLVEEAIARFMPEVVAQNQTPLVRLGCTLPA